MRFDATKFLESLTLRHARLYASNVDDMVVAMAMGNRAALTDARDRLSEVIRETMGVAEILGASLVLQTAAKVLPEEERAAFSIFPSSTSAMIRADTSRLLNFADAPTQTILPRVTFTEALEDMVDRTPTTIRNAAERTARNIAKLYGEGSGGISRVAFVRSAEASVTKRVQSLIAEAIEKGIPELDFVKNGVLQPGAGTQIVDVVDAIRNKTGAWSKGYARMAFRTNVNTAVTAGRFRQVQDPDIKAVIPAFRFDTAGDVDVRGNHRPADGLIFLVDNAAWNKIAPPIGYGCRCQVSLVSLPMLRRMGRVGADGRIREDRLPAAAHPDEGFRHGGRPDLFLIA